jgi:pyridine nucleotide-disulfide oxidoreductase family protein
MKQLVLLGGGHAHVEVMADLARQALPGWSLHLLSPYRRQIYSGMLPGWVAGHYALDDCTIDLQALAQRAGITLHQTAAVHVDANGQRVQGADGSTLPFDLLSIDTGPVAATAKLPGSAEFCLSVRPIEGFVAAWPGLAQRIKAASSRFELVVIGAGAAGLELALAIQYRAAVEGWQQLRLSLLGSGDLPLEGLPLAARRQALRLLEQRGIRWLGNSRVEEVRKDHLCLRQTGAGQGQSQSQSQRKSLRQIMAADASLLVTGAAAPTWPARSGLSTDGGGYIQVGPTLQSLSHPHILAAGDVAAYHSPRPKSGVYAVRAGPVLAANLRALCAGRSPRAWQAQQRALYLISHGGQQATAVWGNHAWSGACSGTWIWRWKDRIDRRFIQGFRSNSTTAP